MKSQLFSIPIFRRKILEKDFQWLHFGDMFIFEVVTMARESFRDSKWVSVTRVHEMCGMYEWEGDRDEDGKGKVALILKVLWSNANTVFFCPLGGDNEGFLIQMIFIIMCYTILKTSLVF